MHQLSKVWMERRFLFSVCMLRYGCLTLGPTALSFII